jgi:hypothetical protein
MILAMLVAIPVNNVGATSTTSTTTTTTTTTSGSSMTITVGTANNAKAGDTVNVRLVGSNNPGISTFGVRLGYDEEYLTYTGTYSWSNTILSNGMQMVNATTVDSKPVVNISAVFSNTYTSNETMVTLSFTVKRDYTDMSTYLTPAVREVTDANLEDVTVNWVYDPNAGLTTDSSQNLVPDDTTNSGTSSGTTGGTTGTTTDGTTSGTTGGTTGNTTDSNTTDGNTSSGNGTTASSGSSGLTTTTTPNGTVKKTTQSSVDNTPSTGTVDLTLILGIVIAVFVGISGLAIYVMKKKRVA